ncbi:MAG: hypothetical protein HYX90_04505 [Chloroflexi bacterium]|nr:hypothetical protein [Chloroflexota bacterium]
MNAVESLVQGSIDMHINQGPDATKDRSVDALHAAMQAQEAGMRAIVLKSQYYPTAPLAQSVTQSVHDLLVFGSICLDYDVGGLNPIALETSALLGAKVVWMPTFSSVNDRKKNNLGEGGIMLVDEKGRILPVVQQILDIVKKHDMVLATGHVAPEEALALVDEAGKRGVAKVVVTHPLEKSCGATLSIEQQRQMVKKGAFIEHCFYGTMPAWKDRIDLAEIVEAVRAIGAEHCILTSDSGQVWNPRPAEGWRMMVADLLRCQVSAEEIELMIKVNPAKLLGLK